MKVFRQYRPWFILFLFWMFFTALLVWLIDSRAFGSLAVLLLVVAAAALVAVGICLRRKVRLKEKRLRQFIQRPEKAELDRLAAVFPELDTTVLEILGRRLKEQEQQAQAARDRLADYEAYVETWAHEIKVPLALLTLLVDNGSVAATTDRDLFYKLDHIREQLQENIDRILVYYRLKSERKDYLLESVSLVDCWADVEADYSPLLAESRLRPEVDLGSYRVYSDRRSLCFILKQLVSNSLKYAGPGQRLVVQAEQDAVTGRVLLTVLDSGPGVKACDLPYVFEQGFTGTGLEGHRQNRATGMGLYLVSQLAADLNIELAADSEWGSYFRISLKF